MLHEPFSLEHLLSFCLLCCTGLFESVDESWFLTSDDWSGTEQSLCLLWAGFAAGWIWLEQHALGLLGDCAALLICYLEIRGSGKSSVLDP